MHSLKLKSLKPQVQQLRSALPTLQPTSWRSDKQSSTARGYGYKWQQARAGYLAKHPLCVYCEREGRVTVATVVDHRVPHRGDMKLFWDRANWQGLCAAHHSGDKQREEAMMGDVIDGRELVREVPERGLLRNDDN
ncbi:HNH endonuclease signature motif containing protein [Duganella sp. Leaf126]|uniref:HNH endonuclease signature motif containing protein n=1 Tax=Duganella sp. Leaf126 TaxID=1736266 RepID=UPI001E29FF67|nr:HNH endonuclease signature motif containing protein [Duganella sp. Leaf126]